MSWEARVPWGEPVEGDEWGLVGFGGDLAPPTLLRAYSEGVFPWFSEGEPICWWSPDPRAIIELDGLHISRRLARTIRSGKFHVTFDTAFRQVMEGCSEREEGTWITDDMLTGYCRMHELGIAHSTEVWRDDELVGGLYGIGLGAFFAGESMFHRESDASKVAMAGLFERLRERGYELFDTQFVTEHTARMGATLISRREYLRRLRRAISRADVTFH